MYGMMRCINKLMYKLNGIVWCMVLYRAVSKYTCMMLHYVTGLELKLKPDYLDTL
jgi:hypothetical protein